MYLRHEFPSAPEASWADVDFISVVRVTASEVVVLNSDGSETRLYSDAGDFVVVGGVVQGTVTAMARTDAGGVTVYEMMNSMSVAAADLLSAGSSRFDFLVSSAAAAASATTFEDLEKPLLAYASTYYLDPPGVLDYVSYAGASSGVVADLSAPWRNTGAAADDMFTPEVRSLMGSFFADVLAGDGADNTLLGSSGDDVLMGRGGADALYGGLGSDWASYADFMSDIVASLSDPTQNRGDAAGDSYYSIENLFGGYGNDILIGDAQANIIAGAAGNDTITTGAGGDEIVFGIGGGIDTVVDFLAGSGAEHDRIYLGPDLGLSTFAELMAGDHIQLMGDSVNLVFGASDRVVLMGVNNVAQLSEVNFRF